MSHMKESHCATSFHPCGECAFVKHLHDEMQCWRTPCRPQNSHERPLTRLTKKNAEREMTHAAHRERYQTIELEQKEIRGYAQSLKAFGWLPLVLGLLANSIALGAVALVAPDWLPVIGPAYVGALVLLAWSDLRWRAVRLQAHNLTLHDELLRTQELLVRFVVPEERQAEAERVVPQSLS